MTPKQKAQELVDKFTLPFSPNIEEAKQCALIAVDEIKEQLLINLDNEISGIHGIYWEMVKQEIQQL